MMMIMFYLFCMIPLLFINLFNCWYIYQFSFCWSYFYMCLIL